MKLNTGNTSAVRLSLLLATILAIFVLDLLTPRETVVWAVYTVPLLLSAMFARWWAPLACAILCTALIVLGFYFSHPPPASMDTVIYSRLAGSAALWAMALILIRSLRLGTSLTMRTEQTRVQANLLNEAQDAIIVRDLENRILYWNRGAAERYGWFEKEAIGRNLHDLLRTQFPGPLHDIMEQTFRDGRWQGELKQSTRDGDQIYVASRWTVQKDTDGQTQAILEINTDITAQRHMVDELRASERHVRTVIENALDAVIGMDERGLITEWNPQAESIFGWTREEVLGRNLAETIIPPEYRERHHAGLERFLTAGESAVLNRRLEMRALHRSGTQLFIELKVSAMKENGAHRFTAFITDITDRKRTEDALRAGEERFRTFMDHSPAAAWMKDEQGRYTYVNKLLEVTFGIPPSAWLGATDDQLWPESTARQLRSNDLAVLVTGKPAELVEVVVHPDGRPHHWWVFKFPLQGENGARYVAGMAVDISERKRAEEDLRRSEEALRTSEQSLRALLLERERLMRNLHDGLVQSLYVIGLSLDECQRLTEEDVKKARAKLEQTVGDVNTVIRQVRQHLTAGDDAMPFTASRLKNELTRVAHSIERANTVRIKLRVESRAAACLTSDERKEVLYVAQEAMSNCLRHSHASIAHVSLRMDRAGVRLEVQDNGLGFDKHVVSERGNGLRNIEERAGKVGAKIEIVSRPKQGTRIRLNIPIHEESSLETRL